MRNNTKRIFTGTAGVYYVMYQLGARGFHASGTMGNAPYLDILVSSEDGERSLALQVKTTEHAMRHRGRGDQRKEHHLEFPLGPKAAKLNRPGVMFAFVDMAILSNKQVAVYLVPSGKVQEYCAAWVDTVAMVRFHPPVEWMKPYREAWDQIAAIVGEPTVVPPEVSPLDIEESVPNSSQESGST